MQSVDRSAVCLCWLLESNAGTPLPISAHTILTPHPRPHAPPHTHNKKDCRRAARALDVGELLCGPDFSLYEAMSALELMDPKMDEALQEVRGSVVCRLVLYGGWS